MKSTIDILKDYILKPKGMMVWRDIPGYEGRYQISNHGEVCSILNKLVSENSTQVILVSLDKSRQNISRNKLLKRYWPEAERFTGEERWKKLDHYGEYYISNYGAAKNCRRLILLPTNGAVWLYNENRENKRMRIVKLFLNTFPPYEVEINDENKTVNYKKKDDLITMPVKATA